MTTVFWDRCGVLLVDFMPQETTIDSSAYCATLRKLRRALQNKQCGMQLKVLPGAAGTDEYLKMEATLSAFENFLQTADANRLKGSSLMLMEFLIPIFHIFSGLVVKKLPSSSVSPSGPPTEDRSMDNAYRHIRDLEKQVALSEGKVQQSQRCFDSVISSLASHIESTVSPFC
ncbi:hypothetical protein TNCV_506131 [Trichonephila clavipes]|nr:hypothetical protein TNCV_506131 [Trichonephila clavipes]